MGWGEPQSTGADGVMVPPELLAWTRSMGRCPYGDRTCPCPDGDACHYETVGDSVAMSWPIRREYGEAVTVRAAPESCCSFDHPHTVGTDEPLMSLDDGFMHFYETTPA